MGLGVSPTYDLWALCMSPMHDLHDLDLHNLDLSPLTSYEEHKTMKGGLRLGYGNQGSTQAEVDKRSNNDVRTSIAGTLHQKS